MTDSVEYHVVRCEKCPHCGEEVKGLLPTVSHGFECPICNEVIRVVNCYTYETKYFSKITNKLKPAKIKGPDIKIRCTGCKHVFDATNVHDGEIRICPKCGEKTKIKRVAGMCEGCWSGIERFVQEGVHVVRCNVCGNYQPVL